MLITDIKDPRYSKVPKITYAPCGNDQEYRWYIVRREDGHSHFLTKNRGWVIWGVEFARLNEEIDMNSYREAVARLKKEEGSQVLFVKQEHD